ncbi:MupG family TIM beta-alpha barrel fold protein [Neobacillus mesonae]|uniref:MupG family TIM beta-alpha barrel fold protein n=1 Tax=Neobacillus mesonae TaxID=1193713 RepID=UPI002041E8B0|nr:MupG family TIM beta-alpha barrel fold protein [Neobacillus mesonae]MCM3569807.1 MupG family TIM beta-alpha barrel fold protein [Neobacillus mesonae]
MIGISFYLNDPLAKERIALAGKKGVKRAFTSLHIPEESGDLAERAKLLLQAAKEAGIEVYADVSRRTPDHLGIENLFYLKKLGVMGLRLDDGFDEDQIISLAKQFKIALNASVLFEDELQRLFAAGLKPGQLIAWHNFYPRPDTGLSEAFFQSQTDLFNKYGIPVSAYIPGNTEKRGPLFSGLPTLEKHRAANPFLAAVEIFHAGVKDVYIGDPGFSEALLERLMEYSQNCAVIRIEGFQEGEFQLRPDLSRDVLRLMNTRSSAHVPPEQTDARFKGTITRDNDLYGRYRGEVQITLRDLPADPRVNVVGKVVEEDLPLLTYLKPCHQIKFIHVHN